MTIFLTKIHTAVTIGTKKSRQTPALVLQWATGLYPRLLQYGNLQFEFLNLRFLCGQLGFEYLFHFGLKRNVQSLPQIHNHIILDDPANPPQYPKLQRGLAKITTQILRRNAKVIGYFVFRNGLLDYKPLGKIAQMRRIAFSLF